MSLKFLVKRNHNRPLCVSVEVLKRKEKKIKQRFFFPNKDKLDKDSQQMAMHQMIFYGPFHKISM